MLAFTTQQCSEEGIDQMSLKKQMSSIIKSLSAVGKPEGASLQPEMKAAQIFQSR